MYKYKKIFLIFLILLSFFFLCSCGEDNHIFINYNGKIVCNKNKTYYIDLDSDGTEEKIIYKNGKLFVNDEDITGCFTDDLVSNIDKNKFYIISGKELDEDEYIRYFYIGLSGNTKEDEKIMTKLVTKEDDNWVNMGILYLTPNEWQFNSLSDNEISNEDINAISAVEESDMFGGCKIYYDYLDFEKVPWSKTATNCLPIAFLETNITEQGEIEEICSEDFYQVKLLNMNYLILNDKVKKSASMLFGYSTSFHSKNAENILLDNWEKLNIIAISENYIVIKKEDTGDYYVFRFDGENFIDGIWIENDSKYSNIKENGKFEPISFDELFIKIKE